jgi:dTDP-4-amino-4,6-dideoxygalactose transaminase
MRSFIHLAQPLFGEEEKKEVLAALDSGWVTLGPRTKQFEEDFAKYVGAKYAVAVSSCTAGLYLALLAAGIGEGDEVITTVLTFAATANTIIHTGARPVFIDVDPKTLNIDPALIEKKITKKTKALMIMHYGGQSCDMTAIKKIALKHKLLIIEDAATAVGTEWKGKKIGCIGDLTVFSFHAIKNMSTGDGGMVTTNSRKLADEMTILRLHGMSKDAWKRHTATGNWRYDVVAPGYKFNMTDIQAAIGIHQLKKLDKFIKIRQKYAKMYDRGFAKTPEITVPFVDERGRHARNLYTVFVDTSNLKIDRDQLVQELKKEQVGANVYYMPLFELSFFRDSLKLNPKEYPVSAEVFPQMLTLPIYPKMTEEDVKYVIQTLNSIIEKNRK